MGDAFWQILHRYEDLLKGGYQTHIDDSPLELKREESKSGASHLLSMEDLEKSIEGCRACNLFSTRSSILLGKGNPQSGIFIIASNPTMEDDDFGEILHGEEGAYLEKWFSSIGLKLMQDCYVTSLVKCMTPGGRVALADELTNCLVFLKQQIRLVSPKVIVALGPYVYATLTGRNNASFENEIKALCASATFMDVKVLPLYHPATVLKNLSLRRPVWNCLNYLKELL